MKIWGVVWIMAVVLFARLLRKRYKSSGHVLWRGDQSIIIAGVIFFFLP